MRASRSTGSSALASTAPRTAGRGDGAGGIRLSAGGVAAGGVAALAPDVGVPPVLFLAES